MAEAEELITLRAELASLRATNQALVDQLEAAQQRVARSGRTKWPLSLTSNRVLLVEGQDEVNFFRKLLDHLTLRDTEVLEVGGKDNFHKEFPAFLNLPGYNNVTSYAIIRDADTDHEDAFKSVKSVLENNKQPCPQKHAEVLNTGVIRVGIFIMPGNSAPTGMLEDLCLQTVVGHTIMPCVETFMQCLKAQGSMFYPHNPSKAKVQAFLAAMPETVNSLGLAALKGYWQFNNQALAELRAFLQELAR